MRVGSFCQRPGLKVLSLFSVIFLLSVSTFISGDSEC